MLKNEREREREGGRGRGRGRERERNTLKVSKVPKLCIQLGHASITNFQKLLIEASFLYKDRSDILNNIINDWKICKILKKASKTKMSGCIICLI